MGILNKNSEALIERRATQFGETPDALIQRLLGGAPSKRAKAAAIMEIGRRSAALPVLDERDWKTLRERPGARDPRSRYVGADRDPRQ